MEVMEVVDYDSQLWFLLRYGETLYLDVRCQQSFMEFSMLVRLTPEEQAAYRASGHAYAHAFALQVNDSPRNYRDRDFEKQLGPLVTKTIVAWRKATENPI